MKQKQLSNKPAQQQNPQRKTQPISRERPDHSPSLADLVQRTQSAPQNLAPGDMLRLQSTFGNRYVQRLLQRLSQTAESKPTLFNQDNAAADTQHNFLEARHVTKDVQRVKTRTVKTDNPLHQQFKRQRRIKPNRFKNKPRGIHHPGKMGEMYQGFSKENKWRNAGNFKALQLLNTQSNMPRPLPLSNSSNTFNINSSPFFSGQLNTPLPLAFPQDLIVPNLISPNIEYKRKRTTRERDEEAPSNPGSFKRKKFGHRLDDNQIFGNILPPPIANEVSPFNLDFFQNGSVDTGSTISTKPETPFPFTSPLPFPSNLSNETSPLSSEQPQSFSFSPQPFNAPIDFNFNAFGENKLELNEKTEEDDSTEEETGIDQPGLVNEGEKLNTLEFPELTFTVTADDIDTDNGIEQEEDFSESIHATTEDNLSQWPKWDHLPEIEPETEMDSGFNSLQQNELNEDMGITNQQFQFEEHNTESQISGLSDKSEQNVTMEDESPTAESETHTLYAAAYRDEANEIIPTMMIQSIPLPVGTFITEMRGRYNNFIAKVKPSPNKMKLASAAYQKKFTTAETEANSKVTSANKIFAKKKSNFQNKHKAEAKVAIALDPVIKAVMNLAKATSVHLEDDNNKYKKKKNKHLSYRNVKNTYNTGKKKKTVKDHYYVKKLSTMAERYRLEGLVAKYGEQPDYLKSGLERDHQPHNALLEKMADMPEFKGRKLKQAAAGRSKNAESIMLHHNRHAAGRTFGGKATKITKQALTDIENERIKLAKLIKKDVDTAVTAVGKLKNPNTDGTELIKVLGKAQKSTDKAQKGDVDKITKTITRLEEAGKLGATAQFNKKSLSNTTFDNAVKAAEEYGDNIRSFCVNYLVDSRNSDISAMKNVIAKSSNFSDLKQTGLNKKAIAKLEKEIINQVTDGEDRIKANDSVIKAYAD